MSNRPVRIFSFEEANKLVSKMTDLTEEVIHDLDNIRRSAASDADALVSPISDVAL